MRVRANSLSLIQLELDGMELGTSTTVYTATANIV